MMSSSDSCRSVADMYGIAVTQLYTWNPVVRYPIALGFPKKVNISNDAKVDCDDPISVQGYYLCVGAAATETSPSWNASPHPSCDNDIVCFDTHAPSPQGAGNARPECPLTGDSRFYTVPGANLTFVRSCDTELVGDDLAQFPTLSMQDCLALCAQLSIYSSSSAGPCEGVTWVYGDGLQGTGINFCYLKTKIMYRGKRGGTESAELWI